MWESPIYKFNQPTGASRNGQHKYLEVIVDVTRSAPSFGEPGKTLEKALNDVFKETGLTEDSDVMDFGAGKLRNAVYLLRKGLRVSAVEYEQMFKESEQAEESLSAAHTFGTRFRRLVYPHQFLASRFMYDIVLLINVLNIMPVPYERMLVLKACHDKLRRGGYLFWYTQRGDAFYKDKLVPEFRLGDGYFLGRNAKYKTFYREFTVAEIDELLSSTGFEYVSTIDATPRNQARLFRRLDRIPLGEVLDPQASLAASVVDPRIRLPQSVKPKEKKQQRRVLKGNPNPEQLERCNLLAQALAKIPPGRVEAQDYQQHVKQMLEVIFRGELRKLQTEVRMIGGIKILDIFASNKSKSGFFYSLKRDHGLVCPRIVIECKNYSEDVGNPEVDQVAGRLGPHFGHVGILAYRSLSKPEQLLQKCRLVFNSDKKLIIPLSDKDFESLLAYRKDNLDREIEDHMDDIVNKVQWK
jgi:hypothetical protein